MTSLEVRAGFPADPASAAKARRFVDATLRSWSCDHLVDVASLLVSELVANAILHAGTTIQVVLRIDDRHLRIEVHDDNPRLPVRKLYSSLSTTGRGLLLVERLADAWGSDGTDSGKVVWFELNQEAQSGQRQSEMFGIDALDFDLDDLSPAERPRHRENGGPNGGGRGPRLRKLVRVPLDGQR